MQSEPRYAHQEETIAMGVLKEKERRTRRARRDQNYSTRSASLPISAEIIKRGEGMKFQEGCAGKGREQGRRGEREIESGRGTRRGSSGK